MFTAGFKKIAVADPDPEKAKAAMKGMNMPVGTQLAKGWANIKSELGFGGGGMNVGKMNQ